MDKVAEIAGLGVDAVPYLGELTHRRHLLAEACRHLALVLRGRRREPGLDEQIVDAARATYCLDISELKTLRGLLPAYLLYTARWSLADLEPARRPPPADHPPGPGPAAPGRPRHTVRAAPALGPGAGAVGGTSRSVAVRAGRPRRRGAPREAAHRFRAGA
ncbi:hypothetical protein ABT288_48845, partial [Streptomyces sp. NPDC001093]